MGNRVPDIIAAFNAYIINTTAYMLLPDAAFTTIWQRLAITTAEKNQWVAFRNEWKDDLYPLYSNKEESRTTAITIKVNKLIEDFTVFSRPILNRISGGVETTIDDLLVFNIKSGPLRKTTTTAKAKITTQPYPLMKALGGMEIKIVVRVEDDASRASMHPDADSIEMLYVVGFSPPASIADTTHQRVYKGAIHIIALAAADKNKNLYAFFRWKNETDDSKSSPWSNIVEVVIG